MDINAKEEEYKDSSYFVRCRGLPYSANEKDIKKFFEGLKHLFRIRFSIFLFK
jgi:hypothetical protein